MNQVPAPNYKPGNQIYKYNLVGKLGEGQHGQVWLANDLALRAQYAVKLLNPGVPVDRRLREAQIGHVLEHNNLVRVHQADVQKFGNDHIVVIAMDYMPRGSVINFMNSGNFLPLPELLRLGKDILQGLDYLHANNFYHNDVKPQNVLVGQLGQAMLTDYGIVGISPDGNPVPAPGAYRLHMAPEVIDEPIKSSVQTDIYQTGLTLFRLAAGLNFLKAKQADLGWKDYCDVVQSGELITKKDFPAFLPNRLRNIILKSVDCDPAKRYSSALEMRRDLEKLAFPGHWTVDAHGKSVGFDERNEYRFVKAPSENKRYNVIAFKKNRTSGNETKVSAHCTKNLTDSKANAHIDKFIRFVVAGK